MWKFLTGTISVATYALKQRCFGRYLFIYLFILNIIIPLYILSMIDKNLIQIFYSTNQSAKFKLSSKMSCMYIVGHHYRQQSFVVRVEGNVQRVGLEENQDCMKN